MYRILSDQELYDIDSSMDSDMRCKLLDLRGGCGCMHPPYNPPCSACTKELTQQEAEELDLVDWIEPEEQTRHDANAAYERAMGVLK